MATTSSFSSDWAPPNFTLCTGNLDFDTGNVTVVGLFSMHIMDMKIDYAAPPNLKFRLNL